MKATRFINAILAVFICLLLVFSVILIVFNYNKTNYIALIGCHKASAEPFHLTNILPGDSKTQNYTLKIHHLKNTTLYFQINETKKSGATNLSEKLLVDVTLKKSGTTLFSGTMSELTQHAVSIELPKNEQGYTTVEYAIHVYFPAEVENDYQFTSFCGDLKWWVNNGATFAPSIYILLTIIIISIMIAAFLIWVVVSKNNCHNDYNNCKFYLVIGLLMLLFILLIITISLFYRTSVLVPGNTFETGGVIVDLNDGKKIFDGSYIVPGEKIIKEITIKNIGTAPVNYRLYLENVRGLLKEELLFNFYFQGTLIKSVHPSDLTMSNPLLSDVPLGSHNKITYTLEVLIPDQIGNLSQQHFLDFDIAVDAIQSKNYPG